MSALKISQLCVQHLGPFDLNITAGECLVLSGPSGTGKSLLLRAIADLIPHQGDVWLGEQRCSQVRPEVWRHDVSLLPAESQWWFDTIGAHFSRYDNELFSALGFDKSVLAWEVSRCSTGERQRLAMIRLLLQQPKALLLDEPTANVDTANTEKMEKIIRKYQQQLQIPVLWVSHQHEQIRRVASRHVILEDNRLTEASL